MDTQKSKGSSKAECSNNYQDKLIAIEYALNILKTDNSTKALEAIEQIMQMSGDYTASASCYCEDCDYETEFLPWKDILAKLSFDGGYIISAGEDGYIGICPKCEGTNLCIGD